MRSPLPLSIALLVAACTPGRTTGPPDDGSASDRHDEVAGTDNDPFLGAGAAPTGLSLAPGDGARIDATLDPADANETWTDSDGFAFEVTGETQLSAELAHDGTGTWSIAVHRADRRMVAWWSMSDAGRAVTAPVTLPAGDYFVHVAADAPELAGSAPYTVTLRTGDLGACAGDGAADHVEVEAATGDNDALAVEWASFPRLTVRDAAPEDTGITVGGSARVIEGVSSAPPADPDSYLDRDAYTIEVGPDTRELRVRVEHASADVNVDVFLLSEDGEALLGTGVEIGDSPEQAAAPVEPNGRYQVVVGARDERAIGGDTALPLAYRVVLCGRGAR